MTKKETQEIKLKRLLNKKAKLIVEISLCIKELKAIYFKNYKGSQICLENFYEYLLKEFSITRRQGHDYLKLASAKEIHVLKVAPSSLIYLAYQDKKSREKVISSKDKNLTLKKIKNMTKGKEPSSYSSSWDTPKDFFDEVSKYNSWEFDLDPCSSTNNLKIRNILTKEQDGLETPWKGKLAWVNPPFDQNRKWLEKAVSSSVDSVFLLPVRTDTAWFHEIVLKKAYKIIFIKSRIAFLKDGKKMANTPFALMLVEFKKSYKGKVKFESYERSFITKQNLKLVS